MNFKRNSTTLSWNTPQVKKLGLNNMSFVGGDLRSLLTNTYPGKMLDEATILRYITQICLGLHHIKIYKILHRDIKPENLLLFNGVIKITDFGIARILEDATNYTGYGTGSIFYMAPE